MRNCVLLYLVNDLEFFISHRLPIAVAARNIGYKVHIVSASSKFAYKVTDLGFTHHIVSLERSGQNIFHELKTLRQLHRVFRTVKPSIVHLITIKPVIYGGIIARITGVNNVVSAVSGLGTVFVGHNLFSRFRKFIIVSLYKSAFKSKNLAVIFQNPDDRDTLLTTGALNSSQVRMIRGSGVDLQDYPYTEEIEKGAVVVMAARLLRDKGVFEFVEAARQIKARNVNVTFRLIGSPDFGNLTSVTENDLDFWLREGLVELLGYRTDIAKQYTAANIVCLPSYREGLPKGLIEAAACSRAVITTDVPGCRDAITPNVTGLLVPPKNVEALANAIELLITNPKQRLAMGIAGRKLAEEAFTIEHVVDQHLEIYKELLSCD